MAGACLEQRPTGAVWYFTGSELVSISQEGKRRVVEQGKARARAVVLNDLLATYVKNELPRLPSDLSL